ncbi:uncharacterized protein LOC103506674 [Diaphorina citri]|uniref:Uncharacterized protein LOC103506674 n=1 Tax=Diaphorina citri TaxID=121845 RepID=A0A3Q0IMD1_DIACI|nr:uncharacterized protein LOC103506674 [Diaphorina citri]
MQHICTAMLDFWDAGSESVRSYYGSYTCPGSYVGSNQHYHCSFGHQLYLRPEIHLQDIEGKENQT